MAANCCHIDSFLYMLMMLSCTVYLFYLFINFLISFTACKCMLMACQQQVLGSVVKKKFKKNLMTAVDKLLINKQSKKLKQILMMHQLIYSVSYGFRGASFDLLCNHLSDKQQKVQQLAQFRKQNFILKCLGKLDPRILNQCVFLALSIVLSHLSETYKLIHLVSNTQNKNLSFI